MQRSNKVKKSRSDKAMIIIAYTVLIVFCVFCLIPFVMVIATSFETESNILREGYKLWPKNFTVEAYRNVIKGGQISKAYVVTILTTVCGTLLSMLVTILMAYPMSLKKVKFRGPVSFFLYFTMLFSGGLVPSYLLISKYLGMRDTLWVLILPVLMSPWNVFMMRNFFNSIPQELSESAYIDGANDLTILFQIILPVSVPGIATISLFYALAYWNQWYNAMLYIDNSTLYPLQYYVMNLTRTMDAIREMAKMTGITVSAMPTISIRMATTVVTIGPIILVYPYVQKHFTSGLMVGSVKG